MLPAGIGSFEIRKDLWNGGYGLRIVDGADVEVFLHGIATRQRLKPLTKSEYLMQG